MSQKFVKFISQTGDGMVFGEFYYVVDKVEDEAFESGTGIVVVNSDGVLQVYESTMFQEGVTYLKLYNGVSGVPAGTCVKVVKEYTHPSIVPGGHGYLVALLVDGGTKKLGRILADNMFVTV